MDRTLPWIGMEWPETPLLCTSEDEWETLVEEPVEAENETCIFMVDVELHWATTLLLPTSAGQGYFRSIIVSTENGEEDVPHWGDPVFSCASGLVQYAQRRVMAFNTLTLQPDVHYKWQLQCKRSATNFAFGIRSYNRVMPKGQN